MDGRLKDRTYLRERHRLSHAQIDKLTGITSKKDSIPEKLKQLETVKTFLYITDLFREKDIYFIPLKGCLLSERIYKDPTIRFSHDIDLLITAKQINSAVELLKKKNFEICKGIIWPKKKAQQELLFNSYHHIEFFNKEKRAMVEIHWSVSDILPISNKKYISLLFNNITEITFGGRKFMVINKEFELLFLLIHGSRHAWERLKWLVDIKDYPTDNINIENWNNLVKRFKAERVIGQADYLLNHYFGTHFFTKTNKKIPSVLRNYPVKKIEHEMIYNESIKEIVASYYYEWFRFPKLSYKLRLLNRFFLRPKDIYNNNFSNKLTYYIYRPYSFFKRRILNEQP